MIDPREKEREKGMKRKMCLYFRGAQRKRRYHRRLRKGQKVMRKLTVHIGRKVNMKKGKLKHTL